MKQKNEIAPWAILWVRAACALAIIDHVLGNHIPIVALQAAELVTVLVNTMMLLIILAGIAVVAGNALLGTDLPKPSKPRTPLQIVLFGLCFATELAAFSLIGWWFTLGLRVTAFFIIKAMPREVAAK